MSIPFNHASSLFYPTNYLSLQSRCFLFARRPSKRNWHGFGRSSRLMLESACIIASKLGVLPAPLELILRDQFGSGGGFGSGSGNGNSNGFGFGRSGGFFDGGRRKRRTKWGKLGVCISVCGVGFWLVMSKELVIDADVLLGGLGLILLGASIDGLRRGAKDWALGFCCCSFLMGLMFKKLEVRTWVKSIGTLNLKKNGRTRRKMRIF